MVGMMGVVAGQLEGTSPEAARPSDFDAWMRAEQRRDFSALLPSEGAGQGGYRHPGSVPQGL